MFENYINPSNSPLFYSHERNELDLFLETITYCNAKISAADKTSELLRLRLRKLRT